jgi:RNA polymerase sigma-70 factor, ECF subfamily
MERVMAHFFVARGESPAISVARADVHRRDAEFASLYERHFRDVFRYVLALTRSRDDADDVTAETFERAYRTWTTDRAPGTLGLPWLLLTARRINTDRWRRLRRRAQVVRDTRTTHAAGASSERTEFWLWFDSVAEVLTDRQHEVLVLRYQRDLTDADIAKVMGLSESGVRSLIARALQRLRAHPELLR